MGNIWSTWQAPTTAMWTTQLGKTLAIWRSLVIITLIVHIKYQHQSCHISITTSPLSSCLILTVCQQWWFEGIFSFSPVTWYQTCFVMCLCNSISTNFSLRNDDDRRNIYDGPVHHPHRGSLRHCHLRPRPCVLLLPTQACRASAR